MDLKKILEYQKIDMDLYRLEKEYSQSKEIELKNKVIKLFEKKKEVLNNLSADLDDLLLQVSKTETKLDELTGRVSAEIEPDKATDENSIIAIEKNFARYEEEVIALNKEIDKLLKRINDLNVDNRKTNEEMISLNNDYKALNVALEKKKNDMLVKARPIVIKLKEILPSVEGPEFDKYKEIRKAKKMPAFVAYQNGNCGACGMDIAIEVDKKLVNIGDIAECPHCGRMVYKYQ